MKFPERLARAIHIQPLPIPQWTTRQMKKRKKKEYDPTAQNWAGTKRRDDVVTFHKAFASSKPQPIWHLVNRMRTPRSLLPRSEALRNADVSSIEYKKWSKVANAETLCQAVEQLERKEALSTGLRPFLKPLTPVFPIQLHAEERESPYGNDDGPFSHISMPPWLTLHLVSHKVKSLPCAELVTPFTMWQLPHMQPELSQPLLILAVRALASWSQQTPVGNLLRAFIHSSNEQNAEENFNLLLMALSFFPSDSPLIAKFTVGAIETMRERQIPISSQSFSSLLASKALTVELTRMLTDRMISGNYLTTAEQLERFLRFYSSRGEADIAGDYLRMLRDKVREGQEQIPMILLPPTVEGEATAVGTDPIITKTTTFDDVPAKKDEDLDGGITRHNLAYLNALRKNKTATFMYFRNMASPDSDSVNTDMPLHRRLNRLSDEKRRSHIHSTREGVAYELLSAYRVLTRRRATTSRALLSSFRDIVLGNGPNSHLPRMQCYTIAMFALMRRKQYNSVRSLFQEYRKHYRGRASLDTDLLRAGVMAFARAGDPIGALELMMEFSDPPSTPSPTSKKRVGRHKAKSIKWDIKFMNAMMQTMHEIGRPDFAFNIWDSLGTGFDLAPDGLSLALILDTARNASFGRTRPNGETRDIKQLFPIVVTEDPKWPQLDEWSDEPAWAHARRIFRGMLFKDFANLGSEFPEETSPWLAFRRKLKGSVMRTYFPPFPVSERPFKSYVHLLISATRGQEIPEVLGWMHYLHLSFSKELLAWAVVGWQEHNSSTEGVMGTMGTAQHFLSWLHESGIELEDGWPTELDLMSARRRFYFEKHAHTSSTI